MKTPGYVYLWFACIGFLFSAALSSCQFGGKETTHEVIIVEPGQVVEIADETQIQVVVKTEAGKQIVTKRKLAGMVAMPKSVYREMRARAYPEEK